MRSQMTAHLPDDLAALYDATVIRRGEIARDRLARGTEAPEPAAVTAEAERLDAVRDILRNPQAALAEVAWSRFWGSGGQDEAVAPESPPEREAAV